MLKFFREARRAISTVVVVAVTAGIATVATLYEGYPTADLNLNDGGVWVTRSVDAMVGHLNYPSRTLDGAMGPPELRSHAAL